MTKRLYQPSTVKEILNRYDFDFKKSLGQNFLIDGNIVERIASVAEEGDIVVEVGPGIGTLTEALARRAEHVYCVEIDDRAVEILKDTLNGFDNITIIHGDILKTDVEEIYKKHGRKLKVIANLPYYVTTPILTHLIGYKKYIDSITVMVQKEVAERIVSKKDTKTYGSLSVFLQYHSDPEILLDVPKTVFMPRPKVDSAVLRLDLKEGVKGVNEDLLEVLVRSAFNKRRKTIANSMSSGFLSADKKEIKKALKAADISPTLRAENLSVEDFIKISKEIEKIV